MNQRSTNSRGQNLTLLVFSGLVVLCSVFFVLGMVVGRTQVAVSAGSEVAETPEMPDEPEPRGAADLTFYESVSRADPPGLDSPAQGADAELEAVIASPGAEETAPGPIFLQVAALRNGDQAELLLDELLDDGFPAFLLRPDPSDEIPLHRVRVGPFATEEAAGIARRGLEDQGFNPIVPR